MQAPMASSLPSGGNSGTAPARAAAIWLYLVASATVLNSLILFRYSRFIDLFIGLSFTQFIDAIFVGLRLEPPGAPWWWTALPALVLDAPFVLTVLVLAVKVSSRRHRATRVAFWLYAIDTFVIALELAASVTIFRSPSRLLAWQSLALVVHVIGLIILFRARRSFVSGPAPA
jgi:hypothetical protein